MTLADYLSECGVPFRFPGHAGVAIHSFKFGERYIITLANGASYDIANLDDMVAIADNELGGQEIAPFMHAGKPGLYVRAPTSISAGHPTMKHAFGERTLAEFLYQEVTLYNLTGRWSESVYKYSDFWQPVERK